MKKTKIILFFISLLVFILSSCSNDKIKIEKDEKGLEEVSIQIDGAATPYYAPLYVAKEKGWFEDEGLDVEFYYATASEIVKNVAVNNVTFGFPNSDPVIMGKSNDIPVKIIHSTYQEGLGSIIFKKNSNITSPSDLKGKTIAITSYGSPNFIQLQVILEEVGLSLNDISIKIIGTGAIVNSLASDQVDAISFSMLRKYDLEEQGVDVDEFRSENYMPTQGNVLITSDELLQQHPEIPKKFTNALNKSLEYLINGHLEEGIQIAVDKYAPTAKGNEKNIKIVMENEFIPNLWQSSDTNEFGFGYSNPERYNKYIELLSDYELIEKSYNANELIENIEYKGEGE